jgi:hypothetical protein
MVGQEQSVRRYEFTGTAAPEQDDGVFEGSLVDAVDVLRGEAEAFGLHVADPLRDQGGKPHALVSACDRGQDTGKEQEQEGKILFHMLSLQRQRYVFFGVPKDFVIFVSIDTCMSE